MLKILWNGKKGDSMNRFTSMATDRQNNENGFTNPMMEVLTHMLTGKGEQNALTLLRACKEGQGTTNPALANIIQVLEQQQQTRQESNNVLDLQAEDSRVSDPDEPQIETPLDVNEFTEQIQQITVAFDALQRRTGMLAAALGACEQCFGEDLLCECCSGCGVPGWAMPHPASFKKYVLPALRRARAVEFEHRRSHPSHEQTNRQSDQSLGTHTERLGGHVARTFNHSGEYGGFDERIVWDQ